LMGKPKRAFFVKERRGFYYSPEKNRLGEGGERELLGGYSGGEMGWVKRAITAEEKSVPPGTEGNKGGKVYLGRVEGRENVKGVTFLDNHREGRKNRKTECLLAE